MCRRHSEIDLFQQNAHEGINVLAFFFQASHLQHMLEGDANGLACLFLDVIQVKFPGAESVARGDKKVEYLVKVCNKLNF
jgi:hypothetical protein